MASIKQYRGKKWRAIIRRVGHPSQSQTFDTKKDAEAWATAIEAKMGVSEYDPLQLKTAKTTTVGSVFDKFIKEVGPKKVGRNEVGTLNRLRKNAKFMAIRLDRVKHTDIRDWRDMRVKQVSPASVNREMNTISGVFTYAMKEWSAPLSANPCHLVTRFKDADVSRDKRWSDKDIAKFLKQCGWKEDQTPKTGRDFVGWALLLGMETAMRIGEICLPLVSEFHPEQKYVHLRKTKNGDARNVPLSTTALRYLTFLCKDRKPDEKIVPINANTMGEYVLDIRRACGLEHLVFHDTRHSAATNLSKKLSNVLELSAVTGHRSLKSLKRYYHPTPADIASKLG